MFINNSPKTLDARFGQGSAFALRVLHLQSVADPLPKARDSQQGNVENPTRLPKWKGNFLVLSTFEEAECTCHFGGGWQPLWSERLSACERIKACVRFVFHVLLPGFYCFRLTRYIWKHP